MLVMLLYTLNSISFYNFFYIYNFLLYFTLSRFTLFHKPQCIQNTNTLLSGLGCALSLRIFWNTPTCSADAHPKLTHVHTCHSNFIGWCISSLTTIHRRARTTHRSMLSIRDAGFWSLRLRRRNIYKFEPANLTRWFLVFSQLWLVRFKLISFKF